ncbi:MAG TPA: ATP-binding protein [Pyrinomonadaceae bacterium]|nr:ATP-binding protein [Pyrinomonadaceae bacterium]
MASPARKQNRIVIAALGAIVLGLGVLLVLLQSSNIWKGLPIERASETLILYGLSSLNVAAFVIFGFIFLRSVVKLVRERRALALGSKIKSRLFFYFTLVSILPIVAMAVFSYLFLNRALDRWFTQIPENVVREAEKIQDRSNADQFERLQSTARILAMTISTKQVDGRELDSIVTTGGLAFAEITDRDGVAIVRGGKDPSNEMPDEVAALRSGNFDAPILRDGSGIDIAVAEIPDGRRIALGVDFRQRESVNQLFNSALVELDRLKDEQFTVRQIGFLTLGVLTFLLIFASSWTAFYIARGLTVPIKALAEGAEKIAQGDVGSRVEVAAEDELELLVFSFNQMASKLEANQTELTERRRYIETILLSLPTGVISLDADGRITTINPSAKGILKFESGDFTGSELSQMIGDEDRETVDRLIARAKRVGHASDQIKLSSSGTEPMPVAITVTALPEDRGVVIVMEDLSELISAQRASAWQEVARRMAHEIKNPLTPIQLSAERIAKRFAAQPVAVGGFDDANARIVNDGTETILREVQSLKSMVDEFSRFARLPSARLELWDVNEVIRQAVALYDGRDEIAIDVHLAQDLPAAMIDDEQLKRVFVNLIDNAIEAPGDDAKQVTVTSRLESARDLIVIEVGDNGRGIDPADYQKLFQPYFSTKGRGTGLGLPIVHRIITEHRGKIKAVPNQPNGAKFIVELPIV